MRAPVMRLRRRRHWLMNVSKPIRASWLDNMEVTIYSTTLRERRKNNGLTRRHLIPFPDPLCGRSGHWFMPGHVAERMVSKSTISRSMNLWVFLIVRVLLVYINHRVQWPCDIVCYCVGLAITRSLVRISPMATVYQQQLSVLSFHGQLMSTSEN